ncbi:MAG TPA: hypothetical protein VLZ75_04695 [Chitinophagales bacterium]|nr:hypothetical protein [Chitinophagales bacterium]
MKQLSTPLFPFLEKHSEPYLKKLKAQDTEEITIENFSEITQLLKEDSILTPSETSMNIIMDYARKKIN